MSERDNSFSGSGNARFMRISTSQLQLGMYVAELDRPWLGTPFLVQGFLVETPEQLRQLGEVCDYVYVDPRASGKKEAPATPVRLEVEGGTSSQFLPQRDRPAEPAAAPKSYEKHFNYPHSIHQEFPRARELYDQACHLIERIQDQARRGLPLELRPLRRLTTALDVSLSHNAHALLWMTRIKHKARYHIEHAVNCGILAMAFGKMLQLGELEVGKLGICGLLFDIGKTRLPPELLDKPDVYDSADRLAMQEHVQLGAELLRESEFPFRFLLEVVDAHHLRPDGRGYPLTVDGAGVSRYARMMSIVDAYDAMTSDRCYATARTNADALKELYSQRGKQFDEQLTELFMRMIGLYPAGTIVQLHNGLCGVTVGGGQKARHLPRVALIRDASGAPIRPRVEDLTHVESGELPRDHLIRSVLGNRQFGIDLEDPLIVAMMSHAIPEVLASKLPDSSLQS